jgi:outer membrane protein assembly factor BamB
MPFTFYKQNETMDCGPTCLRMVAKFYGKRIRVETLREKAQIGKPGVNLLGTSEAAKSKSLPGVSVSDQPFVYNNIVYVAAGDGNLYAVDAGSGVKKWTVAGLYANGSGPIVANGVLYVGGGGSEYFYAIDPANGNVKWKFNTGNATDISYRPLYISGY